MEVRSAPITLFLCGDEAGRSDCDYCMSWRNHSPIFLAPGSLAPV